jgi:hypothetical protein
MVATDVASRGIGMIIDSPPLPFPYLLLLHLLSLSLLILVLSLSHEFVRDLNSVLLSMLVRATCSYNLVQGIIFILILLPLGSLGACRTMLY